MKKVYGFILGALCLLSVNLNAQDTFSIVAVDPATGEVGSAGASCVDLSFFPGYDADFLGELFPGVGAINTQAWYNQTNQANAKARMEAGDTPQQIIDWLVSNDVENSPATRQYGIVRLVDGAPLAAAHTGSNTDDYKNHIVGENYAIQGNILLNQTVLDNMEQGFLNTEGDLACKLMGAMQGANMVGADSRCTSNGTSSLFAFLKVAAPDDTMDSPSLLVSVSTSDGDGIEPIDSLQTLFTAAHNCVVSTKDVNAKPDWVKVNPNPFSDSFVIECAAEQTYTVQVRDINSRIILSQEMHGEQRIDMTSITKGLYFVTITKGDEEHTFKMVKQ